MAVQNDWEFCHLDVKTAYLHGDLEEEVYMAVPQGLEDVPEGYVLKLKKALYGLKQAGRQWYEHLHATMKIFGLTRAESDPHTFVFNHWGQGGLETNENILSTLQALVESTCHLPADNRLGTF